MPSDAPLDTAPQTGERRVAERRVAERRRVPRQSAPENSALLSEFGALAQQIARVERLLLPVRERDQVIDDILNAVGLAAQIGEVLAHVRADLREVAAAQHRLEALLRQHIANAEAPSEGG